MRLKNNIAASANGFLFNPVNGESFTLNQTGVAILELLHNEITQKELLEKLYHKFDVDKSVLEKDVHEFILLLKEQQILENE